MAKKPTLEEFLSGEEYTTDREFMKGFVKHTLGELAAEEEERRKKEKKPRSVVDPFGIFGEDETHS